MIQTNQSINKINSIIIEQSEIWTYTNLFDSSNFIQINKDHLLIKLESKCRLSNRPGHVLINEYNGNPLLFLLKYRRCCNMLFGVVMDVDNFNKIIKIFDSLHEKAKIEVICNRKFYNIDSNEDYTDCVSTQSYQIEVPLDEIVICYEPINEYVPEIKERFINNLNINKEE